MPPVPDRQALVGTRLEDGTYTIDPEEHRRWTEAVFAEDWTSELAHPAYLFLVAHCGMSLDIDAFFEHVGTSPDAGVMFGQGELHYERPLRVGATYNVATEIASVERKEGGKLGPFDVLTCRIEVSDADGLAGVSNESYVIPLREQA